MSGYFVLPETGKQQQSAETKKLIFIYKKSSKPEEAEIQLSVFNNLITKGLKWDENDVEIINCIPGSSRWLTIKEQFSPQICVLFGIAPADFGIQLELQEHHLLTFKKTTFLKTKAIEALEKQVPLKKKFWETLQQALKEQALV